MEASMHALQAIAVIAVLIVGFGASLVVFPTTEVTRGRVQSAAMVNSSSFDHQNASGLPVEKIHDMTFVDPQKDWPSKVTRSKGRDPNCGLPMRAIARRITIYPYLVERAVTLETIFEDFAFAGFLAAQFLGVVAVHAARFDSAGDEYRLPKRKTRKLSAHLDRSNIPIRNLNPPSRSRSNGSLAHHLASFADRDKRRA
jgi:hypothetical protein